MMDGIHCIPPPRASNAAAAARIVGGRATRLVGGCAGGHVGRAPRVGAAAWSAAAVHPLAPPPTPPLQVRGEEKKKKEWE